MHPQPKFSRKTIYNLWSEHVSKKWKRDEDEVKSAKILIEEASNPQNRANEPHGLYTVMPVPLHDEPGFVAIAFVLKEVLRQWGGGIREISLDSACEQFYIFLHLSTNLSLLGNTNKSRFEVYALLGETYGSGCPLGYLLIQSSGNTEEGGKERYLRDLLSYVKDTWGLRALITLTDKDLSEINAFLAVYPEAKHQLCFWHCLRAVKTRLSVLRRCPKYYDVLEAKKEFDWIDEAFVPSAQANGQQVCTTLLCNHTVKS